VDQYEAIQLKGSYLEYAARLIRHDLHSGINTYIPRGMSSLERRLSEEDSRALKIDGALKLIREGLAHTQRVYRRVHDFTSMVKKEATVQKEVQNLGQVLSSFLETTAYRESVELGKDLPDLRINATLFCTAIDNLVRNGLKYNDSIEKLVKIYHEDQYIVIEDNGRGMSQSDFERLSKPQENKTSQSDSGEGLGLSICLAILTEHGFSTTAERAKPTGTRIKIKIDNSK
jgi:signal transduction histidine kinase